MNGTAKCYPRRTLRRRGDGDHRRTGDGKAKLLPFPVPTEIFARFGPFYVQRGFPVFPVRGKTPLVKWWQKTGCGAALRHIQNARFRQAGIGMCCGRKSGITIIDVDEPGQEALEAALTRFGETPLIVRTHSGKHHLYYRCSGEARIIRFEGKKLDVLGEGGFAVLPPSRGAEGWYEFLRGGFDSFDELAPLPTIKPGALTSQVETAPALLSGPPPARRSQPQPPPSTATDVGHRDIDLFSACRRAAIWCQTLKELEDYALSANAEFRPPLQNSQALEKAHRAWKYKQEGRLLVPGAEPITFLRKSELERFTKAPIELALLLLIRSAHAASPGKKFALAVRPLARKLGCRPTRLSAAIRELVQLGYENLKRFSWQETANGYLQLYREIAHGETALAPPAAASVISNS